MRTWSGVLAHIDTMTADGRVLDRNAAGHPPHRDLPLPLIVLDSLNPWREVVGTVDAVWIDGQNVRGRGTVDLDGRPFDARQRLVDGGPIPVSVMVHTPVQPVSAEGGLQFQDWQVAFVRLGDDAPCWSDTTIALDPA